jgi:hypothetical protein
MDHIRWVAPAVPILSTSGYLRPSSEDTEDDYYLRKPFTSNDLLRKVKNVLALAKSGKPGH